MTADLRAGIAGCGKVATLHAKALQSGCGGRLSAVYDVIKERAEAFAAEYQARACDTLTDLFRCSDVIILCTPHPRHAEVGVAAACAGLHVLVEKPLAATLADCDAMIEAAARNRVKLGVVSQRRFYEPVQRMKAALDAGKLGEPVLGTMNMLSWRGEAYYASDPWRGKWATEGGGVLVNQSPHQLDILQWLMGPVEEVSAYWSNLNHPYIEVEDTAVAALRFSGGALGSIVTSLSQKPGIYTKVHIHGATGASVGVQTDTGASFVAGVSGIADPPFNDVWTIPGEEHRLAEFQAQDRASFATVDATVHYHALQLKEFLGAVSEGREPLVNGLEGRKVVALIDAIYRSGTERRPIGLV
ncbi:MAG: Gfo/Idh/MocA family oxidoreductase [Bryobacterales bacterium]|nr:Gfo/Idh/MocA family oxidoreductase [Bryobacterales bacterium]